MVDFLAADYQGDPFVMFGPPHLVVLVLLALIVFAVIRFGPRMTERQRLWFRYGLGTLLIINELAWHVWNYAVGRWTIQTMLPLHLCSILVFATAYMLYTRNTVIFEIAYFLGLGAAIQAIMTPDLGIYGFPHFRFFQTYISHGSMFIAPFYMVFVEGYRPYWRSLVRTVVILNLYMVPVMILNQIIGSNYLFIAHKPETPSLIDVLGPWPWYILSLELIGLVTCLVVYLPWALRDWRAKPAAQEALSD